MKNLETALSEVNWSDLIIYDNVNDNCNAFMAVIQKTIKSFMKNIKQKPRKRNHLPWLNSTIWSLMKQRDYALKTAIKTKTTHDRHKFTSLRNKVTKEIRTTKANFFIELISNTRKC